MTPSASDDAKFPEIPLADLMVPLEFCYEVPEGPVQQQSIADLRSLDFTQAVVRRREACPSIFGLVTVEQLEHLSNEGILLDIDNPTIDRFVLQCEGTELDAYEIAMLEGTGPLGPRERLRHMRPVVPLDCLLQVLSTRSAVLIEWHETAQFLDGTRERDPDPESEPEIVGLIARADLDKHPIRVITYDVLATLETALADPVRRCESNLQGSNTGPVAEATLARLLNAVGKDEGLRGRLGYSSRKAFDKETSRIVRVRNEVMHPVRPLITDAESCLRLEAVVREAIRLAEKVRRQADSKRDAEEGHGGGRASPEASPSRAED